MLTHTISSPRVKICGITNVHDALRAIHAGADAIGLVFFPKSPRYIPPEKAMALTAQLPPFVTITGLFVNADRKEIENIATSCRLDVIQLHGDEPPSACVNLPGRVIKAIRVADATDLEGLEHYRVSGLLLDAKAPGLYGGTGQSFDWSLLAEYDCPAPMILAGGLDPNNVAMAIRKVRPYAVDVSSGVECSPGVKDLEKMSQFIRRVKSSGNTAEVRVENNAIGPTCP